MTEAATDHLAGRRVKPPPSKRRAGPVGNTGVCGTLQRAPLQGAPLGILRANRFRLEGRRVDSIGMQALVDGAGLLAEAGDGLVGDDDVRGRDGLLLVEPPDVQLVDGFYAGDLDNAGPMF